MSDPGTWIGGIGGAAAAVKMAVDLFKARTDARKVKGDNAATLLTATTATGTALATQLHEVRGEVQKLWNEQARQEKRITDHVRWDRKVVESLRSLGGDIDDPPPLTEPEVP